MTTTQTPPLHEAPAAAAVHAALFSETEVVEAIAVPDLDPAAVVAVFSNPL